jgi:RimJ/RimL family protein N-acetyltransferase
MDLNELTDKTALQLSYDYNCSRYDFFSGCNSVNLSELHPRRRLFSTEPDFFKMATLGAGNVISCAEPMYRFAYEMSDKYGANLFEPRALSEISAHIKKSDRILQITQRFLPKRERPPIKETDIFYDIRVFEKHDSHKLYKFTEFENALCRKTGKRTDVLAVCAFYKNKLIGLAGASNDSEMMWQIGVDVAWQYRNNGIAKTLVSALTDEIESLRKIPYYSVAPENIPSANTAISCGYYPAWVEIAAYSV